MCPGGVMDKGVMVKMHAQGLSPLSHLHRGWGQFRLVLGTFSWWGRWE